MKYKITYLLSAFFITIQVIGQSFNYQAVIRDASGAEIRNQTIGIKINLLQGSALGTNVYEETHSVTSNTQGVISLAIGTGTTMGNFSAIDWSSQNYWLEVSADITGGTTYSTIGTTPIISVPYANYAANGPDADPTNEIELPTGGANGEVLTTDGSGNYSWTGKTLADNLGNHTATTNIQLNNNWLSNDGGNEGISIDNNGIITTEAASALTAKFNSSSSGTAAYIEVNNATGTRAIFGPDGTGFSGGNTGDVAVANWSNGNLTFFTNASERMRIESTGNVGIGKNNPNAKLNVNGAIRVDTGGIRVDAGGIRADGAGLLFQAYGANGNLNAVLGEEHVNGGKIGLYNDTGDERFAAIVDNNTDASALFIFGPNSSNIVMGNVSGSNDNGFVGVADPTSSFKAGMYVDANGQGVIYGDIKNFRADHPKDASKEIWYASLEGPEAGAYMRGTGTLVNGMAIIQFPEHYSETVNMNTITMYLTPNSASSEGLSITSKTTKGFKVKELRNGQGNYSFDWVVFGVRKGFEDFEVVRQKNTAVLRKVEGTHKSSISPPAKEIYKAKKTNIPFNNFIEENTNTKIENTEVIQLRKEVEELKKMVARIVDENKLKK